MNIEPNIVQFRKLRDNKLLIINIPYKTKVLSSRLLSNTLRIIIIYWCWLHTLEYSDFLINVPGWKTKKKFHERMVNSVLI